LNSAFLDDLLRPLKDGGSNYQLKILAYLKSVLEKTKNLDEADTVLDTYPDYWNHEEPSKEEKIRTICSRILRAADELWDVADNQQIRALIVQIRFGEFRDKRELLEQIRSKLERAEMAASAREKPVMMLRCFLLPDQPDLLKLQAAQLLLFAAGDQASRLVALEYLASYLEDRNLNYAEQGSIATVMETLLAEKHLGMAVRDRARYLLFIADPKRLQREEEQKSLLSYLRTIAEGEGFASPNAEKRVLAALALFVEEAIPSEKLKKAAHYLQFKITTHTSSDAWSVVSAGS
jgi:hypothetical protein